MDKTGIANLALSNLTKNVNGKFTVEVATHEKYKHLIITLFHEQKGYVDSERVLDGLVPSILQEYEEQYLV